MCVLSLNEAINLLPKSLFKGIKKLRRFLENAGFINVALGGRGGRVRERERRETTNTKQSTNKH